MLTCKEKSCFASRDHGKLRLLYRIAYVKGAYQVRYKPQFPM
jgi:hypothetical protein